MNSGCVNAIMLVFNRYCGCKWSSHAFLCDINTERTHSCDGIWKHVTVEWWVDFRYSVSTLLGSKRSSFGKSRGIKLAFVFNLSQRRGGGVETQHAICDQARLVWPSWLFIVVEMFQCCTSLIHGWIDITIHIEIKQIFTFSTWSRLEVLLSHPWNTF